MATVVPAEGATLQRVVATTPPVASRGLSREAFVKYDAAQARTAWAVRRRRRFALVESGDVLASAERYRPDRNRRRAAREHLWNRGRAAP